MLPDLGKKNITYEGLNCVLFPLPGVFCISVVQNVRVLTGQSQCGSEPTLQGETAWT